MQHIQPYVGHDEHLDCRDMDCDILNPLPILCKTCRFSDLDYVPQPYALVKSKTMVPNEIEPAHAGNLLVRERIKQMLELIAPGQCQFYPTVFNKTTDPTPWHLAVPQHQVEVATVVDVFPCKTCGRCTNVHPGTHYKEIHFGYVYPVGRKSVRYTNESEYDILKTSTWYTSGPGPSPENSRAFYLSVRLLYLLRVFHVDIDQQTGIRPNPGAGPHEPKFIREAPQLPDAEDQAWIAQMKERLVAAGIPLHPPGTTSKAETRWFNSYLRKHRQATADKLEIKAVEKELGFKLPPSYVKLFQQVGTASFDAEEGYTVTLLPPDKVYELDDDMVQENHPDIRALVFAETDFGDVFCFELKPDQREYGVLQLNHETFCLEPYAANFVQCLQRLTGDE